MLRVFQAGAIAALCQAVAVVLMPFSIFALSKYGLIDSMSFAIDSGVESLWIVMHPLLKWAYVLIAIGLALTCDRFVDETGSRIRAASRLICPDKPFHATKTLFVQLSLAIMASVIFTIQQPPPWWLELGRYVGVEGISLVAWPGIMSIGLAYFGANAHAALKAL